MVEYRSRTDRLKNSWRSTKSRLRHEVFIPQNFLLIILPIIMVAWFIGTIASLNRNWELQQQIASTKINKQYLELEVESLELENQYYASEEYQELTARRLQNKKLPGEVLIYLPDNSIAAQNKYKEQDNKQVEKKEPSNFNQWMTYLFGA